MLNANLSKLFTIAQKPERIIVGLMSGTSLDGLDIALCRISGSGFNTTFELLDFATVAYMDTFRQDVREVFAQKQVSLEKLCLLNASIGSLHGEYVSNMLQHWGYQAGDVDLIASHGQTVYHAPQRLHGLAGYPNATLQIGDADHIAVKTGVITISDFRQKHVAGGGEGAPLVLYGDVLLGSHPHQNRILLNIGGIANLTWLPANKQNIICTDVGPGNTLIDAACQKYFNQPYDNGGRIALSGRVSQPLLTQLLQHPFFTQPAPKTTGPELFSKQYVQEAQQKSDTLGIQPQDLVATLTAFTAEGIINFVKANVADNITQLLLSGGGAKNTCLVNHLRKAFPAVQIADTNIIGINADAKEAILFALLANEAVAGEPVSIGTNPAILMGKFSFPA
ncbi:anhydro-N-acetylmuramic acid kinase [Mucilaginibacter sp. PAMB04274]|uniref:anhydro-N-acetylmuramic acid kinase n=1 Tax=Mucilaginibacter sp. PAMB04274 TaxID=3138568 RepID=UPI0031F604A8